MRKFDPKLVERARSLGVELRVPKNEPALRGESAIHPLSRAVREAIPILEFDQFRHPEDRERLNEIRLLAIDQLTDDVGESERERLGRRGRVTPIDPQTARDDPWTIWPERTEEQRDRTEGMGTILTVLTGEQRIVVRMRYDSQMTQEEIAAVLNITQQAVDQRLKRVHERLRKALLALVGEEEVVEVD